MSWVKLDDGMWRNPKIQGVLRRRVGPEAIALYVLMLSFAADQLTDGVVDKADIRQIVDWPGQRLGARLGALIEAGLLESSESPTGAPSFRIHDYLQFNPTRDEVLARRENDKVRQRKHRRTLYVVTP